MEEKRRCIVGFSVKNAVRTAGAMRTAWDYVCEWMIDESAKHFVLSMLLLFALMVNCDNIYYNIQ